MDKEINILGGGISGLACAIILRNNGYKVNIYEKGSYVGKRFNDDWQGLENWSEKIDVLKQIESYGIDLSFDYEPISELSVHYSDKMKTASVKNGCYLVRRGSKEGCLDKALLEQAEKLGAKIHFNYRQDRKMTAKVNATGPKKATAYVRGIKFNTRSEIGYHMAFGQDIARGFYSYLLTKNGHGTIATVYERRSTHRSEEFLQNTVNYFSDFLDKKEVAAGKKFGGYGQFEIKNNYYDENGAMLIGEAGGFQDYLWGFGMRYAFQSANLAARSIMQNESYDDLVEEHLINKMKHSNRNRRISEIAGPLAYPLQYYMFTLSKNPLKILNILCR
jgi:flavin-dependent dehydrogenase